MFVFAKEWVIQLFKKVLNKAKTDNYFERKICTTRTKSGNIKVTSLTNNTTNWVSKSFAAPNSGWYWCMCEGGNNTYRALYINCMGAEARNAQSNNGRNQGAGPVYAVKGQTVTYGCVYGNPMSVYYSPSYEY